MSLINLLVAARSALARHRQRRRAYEELMALDDRSLADIGIHRSQIPALVEGAAPFGRSGAAADPVAAAAFGGVPRFATGRPWLPPL
jgi:uncharacterized protein YjiS (DUF1127 family)